MLRRIRILLAAIFFIGITSLFLDFSGTVQPCLGWMAKLQFLPSVLALNFISIIVVLGLTLAMGRLYCSVICPLGVMQDVFAWIGKWRVFRKNKKTKAANKYSHSKPKTWLRLSVLALMVVMILAGFNAGVMLLAPYSSYGRIVTAALQPIYIGINNLLATWAEGADSYAFYQVEPHNTPTLLCIVAGISALVLFVLAFRNGRTYCNTICPVGTILSFFARFSWLKIRFDEDKCKKCGKCARNCKASCIDFKNMTVDYSRCVVCGDCLEQCNFDSLHYAGARAGSSRYSSSSSGSRESSSSRDSSDSADEGRRSFLIGAALATTAAALAQEKKKVDGGLAVIEDKLEPVRHTPITPPGSLSASNMQKRCTGCQLCVSECPNDVLRPSTDLMKLMQPTMSYERGYCRPECNRCSEVCPAGAIQPITLADKSSTQIGHAVWVKKNCISVTDGVECGNCERHCPVGAIEMVMLDENDEESVLIPSVNEARCIGCGACENLCPARPFAAIYVEGHEVHKTI